jgi:hypothetical protein
VFDKFSPRNKKRYSSTGAAPPVLGVQSRRAHPDSVGR